MSDYRTAKSFLKAFKSRFTNFDNTKVFIIPKSRPQLNGLAVHFVSNSVRYHINMYMSTFEIDTWEDNFREYFNTGVFPMTMGWVYYPPDKINSTDINKEYKFNLLKHSSGELTLHSRDQNEALTKYRIDYPACGIMSAGMYRRVYEHRT